MSASTTIVLVFHAAKGGSCPTKFTVHFYHAGPQALSNPLGMFIAGSLNIVCKAVGSVGGHSDTAGLIIIVLNENCDRLDGVISEASEIPRWSHWLTLSAFI